KNALLESYLSCHVCSETFRDPVSLSCSHSFCSSCLQRFWEQAGNKNCPICKSKSSTDEPAVNLTLKGLADSFADRQNNGSTQTQPEKEKEEVVPVILDPNTANYFLSLSDDLTSVRYGIINQQLPDNSERFTKYADVLGSEGFSSGKHSWEVEVGDHPLWFVGLVKESVDRKGETGASTGDGFWCLALHNEIYTNGVGRPLRVKKSLQRIRVQLDYDRGDVSFYDPEDTTHIYTYRDTFTEK
uniref:Uncharacterized protein n=1 Tax=Gasterosteus aculeatus TaxID=69293 RepID=G3PP00_GASAC